MDNINTLLNIDGTYKVISKLIKEKIDNVNYRNRMYLILKLQESNFIWSKVYCMSKFNKETAILCNRDGIPYILGFLL